MRIDQSIIDRLWEEQKGICACGCGRPLTKSGPGKARAHHGIYTRDERFAEWLDMAENLFLIRDDCHKSEHGRLTNWFWRSLFWTEKLKFYDMHKWHDSIPMLVKDKFYEFDK